MKIYLRTILAVYIVLFYTSAFAYQFIAGGIGAGAPPVATICYGAACPGAPTPPTQTTPAIYQAGVNATYGSTNCTPSGNGVTDNTSCIQAALNSNSSVLIKAGTGANGSSYWITGPVYVPSNEKIQCDNGGPPAAGSTTAINFINTTYDSTTYIVMFNMIDTANASIFWCQFRGYNYNRTVAIPENFSTPYRLFIRFGESAAGTTHDDIVAENDFDGGSGTVGNVTFSYSNTLSIINSPPTRITFSYNTAENCGYRIIESTMMSNSTFAYNTMVDCGLEMEGITSDAGSPAFPTLANNTFNNNFLNVVNGSGAAQVGGQVPAGNIETWIGETFNGLGGSVSADFHTNLFKQNKITAAAAYSSSPASGGLRIYNQTSGSPCGLYGGTLSVTPGVFQQNICVGPNCGVLCSPGYTGSDV